MSRFKFLLNMSIKFSYAQKQITPLGSKFLEETQNYEELVFKTT